MMWHNQLFTPSLRIMFQGVEHLGFGKDVQFVNTKRLPSQSFGQAQHSSQRFGVTRVIPRWSGVVTWMIGDGRSEVQSQVDYSRTLGHCSSVSCVSHWGNCYITTLIQRSHPTDACVPLPPVVQTLHYTGSIQQANLTRRSPSATWGRVGGRENVSSEHR